MTTDFFERQDQARRLTKRLIFLFALAVITIIVAVYLTFAATYYYSHSRLLPAEIAQRTQVEIARGIPAVHLARPSFWQPKLFLWVVLGVSTVILLGSLYKISELSQGGEGIALMLGGRAVDPQTTDLAERRLLNVVEEMALASGIPVPPVFIMDEERSINAFAAGHGPGDAVVAVSAGGLKYLNREELQGVVGHEFSHILNGDMKLNLRLIGIVHGILILAIIGYYAMRSSSYSSSSDKSGSAIFGIGLVLVVFGYLGVFFGNLIKSAVNRQREFLADASAVQFTRYPAGIAGALKKIGGLSEGSRIREAHAQEVSHMFFGDAFAGSFFNLFATHPPLAARIKALEPDFNGEFPTVRPVDVGGEEVSQPTSPKGRSRIPLPLPLPGVLGGAAAAATMGFTSANAMDDSSQRVGGMRMENLRQAGEIIAGLPPMLLAAVREPYSAQAIIFALLMSRDDGATRAKQLELLQGQISSPFYRELERMYAALASLPVSARLPLVDLSIPALKRSSAPQYVQFRKIVEDLVHADGKVDFFEYCLRMVLFSYLDVHFGVKKPPAVRYKTLGAISQPTIEVLSALAYIGQKEQNDVLRAFQAGIRGRFEGAAILAREKCSLRTFDAALTELASASPLMKREILASVSACIAADGQITLSEDELLRTIAAVLACPLPPIAAIRAE